MHLLYLLEGIYPLCLQADCDISDLFLDSRAVRSQGLFFALPGTQRDGRHYIDEAIARGAAAVLVESETMSSEAIEWQSGIPLIPIYQLAARLGEIAARFYAYPTRQLRMIGVTGTSGKTSCTHFIAQALYDAPCALIGTLGSGFLGALGQAGLTTPDAVTLQQLCQSFVKAGAKAVAMEVSSHSIAQDRIQGIHFDIGIFTNLSQDHLDYHGDMASYAKVKYHFLAQSMTEKLILNIDDPYAKRWLSELSALKPVIAYSINQPEEMIARVHYVHTESVTVSPEGITAALVTPWGKGQMHLPLLGLFNLSNGLAALAALCADGMPLDVALARLATITAVPGRMQKIKMAARPLVVVDYAHKPDALEKVLLTLRHLTKGKIYCVFGCGGERDRTKRPLMATIAERLADHVIITNDNPRHEDPKAITADIMKGFVHPECISVELDRSKAIENSIQWASVEDCVLIAGKGAEHYQQIGDEKIPFDDVEKANLFLTKTPD